MFSAFSQSLFAYECILHPFEKVMGFGRATRFALRAPFVLGASTFKTGR
jgi:hypothetical protein